AAGPVHAVLRTGCPRVTLGAGRVDGGSGRLVWCGVERKRPCFEVRTLLLCLGTLLAEAPLRALVGPPVAPVRLRRGHARARFAVTRFAVDVEFFVCGRAAFEPTYCAHTRAGGRLVLETGRLEGLEPRTLVRSRRTPHDHVAPESS